MDSLKSATAPALNLSSAVGRGRCKAGGVGQTFLSASWSGFPAAPTPDWKVRRTGRLESLSHAVCGRIAGSQLRNSRSLAESPYERGLLSGELLQTKPACADEKQRRANEVQQLLEQ